MVKKPTDDIHNHAFEMVLQEGPSQNYFLNANSDEIYFS